jgi:aryl-alcohol dehydrogenase-like predicted oxidoreductase
LKPDFNKVVIGTWTLGGDFGHVKLLDVARVLDHSYDLGFREYDTAPNYGNGFVEFCIGKSFFNKKDITVNTKVGNIPFYGKGFELEIIKKSFNQSLLRLGGLQVNVLFLHNPRHEIKDYEVILEYLNSLKRQGKIQKIGLSKAKGFAYEEVVDLNEFDVIQDDVNLLYMDPIIHQSNSDIELMARSPLATGILSGKLSKNTVFLDGDLRSSWLKGERLESILKRVNIIKQQIDRPIPSIARQFLLSNKNISKIIFGVKRVEHLDDLVQEFNNQPITQDELNTLIKLYENDFGLINEKHLAY